MTYRWILATVFPVVLVIPLEAGGLFSRFRSSGEGPTPQPKELVAIARTHPEAEKRAEAIQELRNFDTTQYPDIVALLVESLQKDSDVGVRIEAARSLGRIRPLTSAAGEALSRASLRDSAFRVRWQARTSLMYYTMAGINPLNYRGSDQEAQPKLPKKGEEPPLGPGPQEIFGAVTPTGPTQDLPVLIPPPPSTTFARELPRGPMEQPVSVPNPGQGSNLGGPNLPAPQIVPGGGNVPSGWRPNQGNRPQEGPILGPPPF